MKKFSKLQVAVLVAIAVVATVPVVAQGHGSVSHDVTRPNREGPSVLGGEADANATDQHDATRSFFTLQRKTGTSWTSIDGTTVQVFDNRGFTNWNIGGECSGTGTGTATFRWKQETFFENDQGETAHHLGPSNTSGISISNTACFDDA